MTQTIGTWGSEVFGRGYFGWAQVGVPISFSLMNARLLGLLTQTPPNAQVISTEVLIANQDVSASVERFDISFSEDSRTGFCSLTLIGDAPSGLADGAGVEINQTFILEDGTQYTTQVFLGRVKAFTPSSGGLNRSVQVSCWDWVETNLSAAPHNSTWTGTARALVSDELTRCGCPDHDLGFTDFSLSSATLSFQTVRDLINTIANQADEARIISLVSGKVLVWSYSQYRNSSIVIPQAGYTSMQEPSSKSDRYKSYAVTGSAGATSTALGTGDYDDGETLAYVADGSARASAVITKSERARRLVQMPINPYLRIGDRFVIVRDSGNEAIRTTGIAHSCQWTGESSPGCWTSVSGEVIT